MASLFPGIVRSLRRCRADLCAAALERRVRRDPKDIGRRCSAIAHYCKQVSAGRLGEEENADMLERTRDHLEYILGATCDIHRLHTVITRAVGAKMFYQLPELTARYMRKIGLDPECLEEFDTRSEFEERATPYHLGNALGVLKAAGCHGAAKTLFEEAVSFEWRGQQPVRWRRVEQTPAVYIHGLEHHPFWEGEIRPPLAALLEEQWLEILEDLDTLLRRYRRAAPQVPAYPNLVRGNGVWDMLQLYSGRIWHPEASDLAPRTSALLKHYLPSADLPYIHYNTEEAVFFLLAPGTRVRLHNGGSNGSINLSLGLRGCAGSHIEVGGITRAFRDGEVVCFDDGTDHCVWHDGPEERWVLVVRQLHPQLVSEPARYYSRAFTNRTCFESWDDARAAQLLALGGAGASCTG